jgi:hypothetical protein
VQPLLIVDLLDEASDGRARFGHVPVLLSIAFGN